MTLRTQGCSGRPSDGGGILSNDSAALVAVGGGNLVAAGGGNLTAAASNEIISHDGGGFVAALAATADKIISHDGGGLVSSSGGNFGLLSTETKSASDLEALEASRPKTFTPTITLQSAHVIGTDRLVGEMAPGGTQQVDPATAALSTGKYVVTWADTLATSGHFEIRAQIHNANGTPSGSSFLVSTDTGSDQSKPSVGALADGQFVVTWTGKSFDSTGQKTAADVHTSSSTEPVRRSAPSSVSEPRAGRDGSAGRRDFEWRLCPAPAGRHAPGFRQYRARSVLRQGWRRSRHLRLRLDRPGHDEARGRRDGPSGRGRRDRLCGA